MGDTVDIGTLRHSTAHIMAQAVKRLWPDTKIAIGPAISDGFYYDFDRKAPFLPEELTKIEEEMTKIIKADYKFTRKEVKKEEALKFFEKEGEAYKTDLIKEIPEAVVTLYTDGDFTDLCKGPHISSTGQIKVFKLLGIAGAYWRGSEKNPMLQRIYGVAFFTKDELEKHLQFLEEAKNRDHRRLGKELEFYLIDETAGPGLVVYQPKGAILRTIIEDWEKKEHIKRGYEMLISPHILKSDIWIRSGHYDFYKEHMYIFKDGGEEYAVKPMNCPGHILVYKSKTRSYKDLPIRYFELGSVYRNEKSGVLHGLLRVRGFTQDDAHIFCLPQQLKDEIKSVIDFVIYAMGVFGFDTYEVEVSTRPEKSIGAEQDWQQATLALEESLRDKGIPYKINEGEGAFYGPKVDIKLKDALGRLWQCATIQCDFALPERFDLTYAAQDGTEQRPVMIHRVILGSMERFIGALIEHYAACMPLWLSPVQVVVMSITDKQLSYAKKIKDELVKNEVRVKLDSKNQTIGYKIRQAQLEKVPYMIVLGAKEEGQNKITVRSREKGDEGQSTLNEFIERMKKELKKEDT